MWEIISGPVFNFMLIGLVFSLLFNGWYWYGKTYKSTCPTKCEEYVTWVAFLAMGSWFGIYFTISEKILRTRKYRKLVEKEGGFEAYRRLYLNYTLDWVDRGEFGKVKKCNERIAKCEADEDYEELYQEIQWLRTEGPKWIQAEEGV